MPDKGINYKMTNETFTNLKNNNEAVVMLERMDMNNLLVEGSHGSQSGEKTEQATGTTNPQIGSANKLEGSETTKFRKPGPASVKQSSTRTRTRSSSTSSNASNMSRDLINSSERNSRSASMAESTRAARQADRKMKRLAMRYIMKKRSSSESEMESEEERYNKTEEDVTMVSESAEEVRETEITDKRNSAGKRKVNRKRKLTKKEEEKNLELVDGYMDETAAISRKKGRKQTTGWYVGRTAAVEELIKKQREAAELEAEKRIRTMSFDQLYTSMKLDLDDAVERLRKIPTADVANRARECLKAVLSVAKSSKNLKGTKIKELKQASIVSAAAVEVLRSRSDCEEDRDKDVAAQIKKLRNDLAQARIEIKLAKEKIAKLKAELEIKSREGKRVTKNKMVI